jgi:hypothetical protein
VLDDDDVDDVQAQVLEQRQRSDRGPKVAVGARCP